MTQNATRHEIGIAGGFRVCAALALAACFVPLARAQRSTSNALPDAPSAILARAGDLGLGGGEPTCDPTKPLDGLVLNGKPIPGSAPQPQQQPCKPENRIQLVISSKATGPLSSKDKAKLAIKDFTDPFNLASIVAYSAVAVAVNSHSAYGPGYRGWGKLTGYSLAEDATSDFFSIYAIPSLVHEDPRYRRMPGKPVPRRILHAITHTFVAQHDHGGNMPNYATLLTYPISAEVSDMYVPGVQTDIKSTAQRVAIGIATDPAGNLVNEFLPDIARHIHIHVLFFQEILNRVATGGSEPTVM